MGIDTQLFYFFNRTIANPVFDVIFPFITKETHWLPVYIVMFLWLFIKGGRTGRMCGIALIVGVVISDRLCSDVLKELFGRIRPCHVLPDVRLLVPCGVGKAFPSSHAFNNFTAAVILTGFYRKQLWLFFTIASLIAFSRVYVGVHYPFDVLVGAAMGAALGLLILFIFRKIQNRYFNEVPKQKIDK